MGKRQASSTFRGVLKVIGRLFMSRLAWWEYSKSDQRLMSSTDHNLSEIWKFSVVYSDFYQEVRSDLIQ